MPIEIKELHISVAVNAQQGTAAPASPAAGAQAGGGDVEREAIVAECVEQVLQVLRNKSER